MVGVGKTFRGAVLGVGVAALVTACGSGGDSKGNASAGSATSTVAADVPAGFDACKLPDSLLQTEQLIKPESDVKDGAGGVKWRGCGWIQSDGYSATIDTTNITLAMVRANKDFKVGEEFTVSGRPALISSVGDQDARADCTVNIEIKGGSAGGCHDNRVRTGLLHSQTYSSTMEVV